LDKVKPLVLLRLSIPRGRVSARADKGDYVADDCKHEDLKLICPTCKERICNRRTTSRQNRRVGKAARRCGKRKPGSHLHEA
jgi:hypothetical protein